MRNTLALSGKIPFSSTLSGTIPFSSAARAQDAQRMLDGMLAGTVCSNNSDCQANVLRIDVELATTTIAEDIASTLAKMGAISGVVIVKDPDAGIGDEAPTVAVIPIPNGRERLSMLDHALESLRDNLGDGVLSDEEMVRIEDFARSLVADKDPTASAVQVTQDIPMRDEIAEWAGHHYGVNFDAEPRKMQLEWAERYADMLSENDAQQHAGHEDLMSMGS